MTCVIGEPCVDVPDRACAEERLVEAIYYEDGLPEQRQVYAGENRKFFAGPLPGRDEPRESGGGRDDGDHLRGF